MFLLCLRKPESGLCRVSCGGNKSGQAPCVGEECEVGCGGGGVLSVFVLGILCKHVFLWVCAYNYGFPSPRRSPSELLMLSLSL